MLFQEIYNSVMRRHHYETRGKIENEGQTIRARLHELLDEDAFESRNELLPGDCDGSAPHAEIPSTRPAGASARRG